MSEQSKQIIDQLSSDIFKNLQTAKENFQNLVNFIVSYEEILKDLISTKKQYVEIIKKYTSEIQTGVNPTLFTGLVAATPQYSASEMKLDSQTLEEMGKLVEELESQKDIAYSQIQQLAQAGTRSLASATSTSGQMEMFLNQDIQDSSGNNTYGSAKMLQLISI